MKVHQRYSTGSVLFFAGLLFCFLCIDLQPILAANTSSDAFQIIKVKKRPAKELLPQVQTVLSPTGRASVDTISNAIIVSDTPETVENIQRLIARLDQPVPQITLRLRYRQAGTKTRSLSTAGGISGKYSVSTPSSPDPASSHMAQYSSQAGLSEPGALPKHLQPSGLGTNSVRPQGVTISGGEGGLRMHTDAFNQSQTLQLTLSSGSSGYLMVGRDIPFTDYWLNLCSRYGYRFGWLTRYKRVESGFEVHAVVLGSRVDLTLVPRLSFDDSREIRFTKAATRITIPIDTWVPVAASDAGTDLVSAAIVTANGQSNSRAMVIEVKARVR